MTQEAYDAILGIDETTEEAILQGPLADLRTFHGELHARILRELAGIGDHEIDLPSFYWEGTPISLRFRLHRFNSHMRQHTVQIDKTLANLDQAPSEARRLLRLIYAALAEAEGAAIGAENLGAAMQQATVNSIAVLTAEIAPSLTLDGRVIGDWIFLRRKVQPS